MRVVSLLPSATEIVHFLGAGDTLVGVSHECDYPPSVRALPKLTRAAVDTEQMSPAEIDAAISELVASGASTYGIDGELLRALEPDLVITQALCEVCAVSDGLVHRAVHEAELGARVLTLRPGTLDAVLDSIEEVGEALRVAAEARRRTDALRRQLAAVRGTSRHRRRPRVLTLEWFEPPFVGGHWVPDQVEAAGGVDALGQGGEKSRRATWDEIAAAQPDVVVLLPCGYGLDAICEQASALEDNPVWRELPAVQAGAVWAVDANGCFSRPGPRVVEGVGMLSRIVADPLSDESLPGARRLGGVVRQVG